jgi:hypothetical protein
MTRSVGEEGGRSSVSPRSRIGVQVTQGRLIVQYHTSAPSGQATLRTILLLVCSNAFMTVAWYGHLKFKSHELWVVILASWLIALPEYALQVPANRIGHGQFSAPALKVIQEVISISVFLVFSYFYLRETPRWNEWLAMLLIVAAVFVMMAPRLLKTAVEATTQ